MYKYFVEYVEAKCAAERGGIVLSADEYNGFADIGTDGVLEGGNKTNGELRLTDDADGGFDGYEACDPRETIRDTSLSSACLRREADGAVKIKLRKTEESTEI